MLEPERAQWPDRLNRGREQVHAMWAWYVTNRPTARLVIAMLEKLYRQLGAVAFELGNANQQEAQADVIRRVYEAERADPTPIDKQEPLERGDE